MNELLARLYQHLDAYLPREAWMQTLLGLGVLIIVALAVQWLVRRVALYVAHQLLDLSGRRHWSDALATHGVYRNLAHTAPFAVVASGITLVTGLDGVAPFIGRVAHALAWVFLFLSAKGVLNACHDVYSAATKDRPHNQTHSIKGYIQLGKIALTVLCAVLVVSIVLDRSPALMISGLGALSAVLLLVFKDTLLSVVASTQLTTNDMLRIGDWIEMPQAGADGFVIDIALHTVKVQNWDQTVTTVPTYKLFSESYRNYRHMFESGGRRIKRTLRLDAASVRFLDDAECDALIRFRLLHDYLNAKRHEVAATNQALGEAAVVPANRRRLTNIGTFRAYAMAYLKQHPEIHQNMIMLVRMMEPQPTGIPIEIYAFTATTAWVEYERIQGDIFDHLLAVLSELGLRLYQSPSGSDFSALVAAGREAAPLMPPPVPSSAPLPEKNWR